MKMKVNLRFCLLMTITLCVLIIYFFNDMMLAKNVSLNGSHTNVTNRNNVAPLKTDIKNITITKPPTNAYTTIKIANTSTTSTTTQRTSAKTTTKYQTTATTSKTTPSPKTPSPYECYKNPGNLPTLPNIQSRKPKAGKSIVFLETSCKSRNKGKIHLTVRQACSVESAALMNPNHEVHLLFTATAIMKNTTDREDRIMNVLTSYKNIFISRIDIDQYFAETPVTELYKSGLMETSSVPLVHLSDVLRFVSMWRYGCIYLDLDVIVLKNFEGIEPNFTGLEWDGSIASGVMNFALEGKGHEWVESILKDVNRSFKPKAWSYNANGAVTRLLTKVCNTSKTGEMTKERCQGFTVHPREVFYPLFPWHWEMFFNHTRLSDSMRLLANSRSVHMWNAMSSGGRVVLGKNSAYEIVAMEYCPKVYAQLGNNGTFK